MNAEIRRVETTHADEITRTVTGSVQWFLEHRHKAGTHPISSNNKLRFFICGEEAFRDIAAEITQAKQSIDLCCWGFDPGMELVRDHTSWPRGPTFGDLLIEAGKRGVKVRLLVWYDALASQLAMKNMPGHSHGFSPWLRLHDTKITREINALYSVACAQAINKGRQAFESKFSAKGYYIRDGNFPLEEQALRSAAREEYCFHWYQAAFAGKLKNIEVRKRGGNSDANKSALANEKIQPDVAERALLTHEGTHHQKPILIDFNYENGRKAVGYVMGLNAVTDYWDTCQHKVDDLKRERGAEKEAKERVEEKAKEFGFPTLKPYHDYACRIEAGGALISIEKNFVDAWSRAGGKSATNSASDRPTHLLRKGAPDECCAQILRTDPLDRDQTIRELYFHIADQAANAVGYLYIENQYFQYEEWCQRLLSSRRKVVEQWKRNCQKAGRAFEQMPMLHIFIVVPIPEREEMIPRTYDALATLGQHQTMAGQQAAIDSQYRPNKTVSKIPQRPVQHRVIVHGNNIHKPSLRELEDEFGVRISVVMLNSCGIRQGKWTYREIYNHSKLIIIDDAFLTLGSANLNQRSMTVDSEINIATDDSSAIRQLRARILNLHSGGKVSGGNGSRHEIWDTFDKWRAAAVANLFKRGADTDDDALKSIHGFIVALHDERRSVARVA